jgi:hypothetical protein
MGPHDGAVDRRVFIVGVSSQMAEEAGPNAGFRPAAEAAVHVLSVAEALRQVPPGNAGAIAEQHRFDEQAVVGRGHTHRTGPAGQQVFDLGPLVIAKA